MPGAKFTPDSRGIGQMLNSEMMRRGMEVFAEEIRLRAEVIAPVYEGPGRDPHRGRYKASFHVRSHLNGGVKNDRAEAIVYNDSPEAIYVEFGHRGAEPWHVLARAAFRPLKGTA
jgi:hypothetical protein